MAVRAAVARHVLQLTLRREFTTALRLRDDKPGSAHDWATRVLSLPRNDWDGTVTPALPSPKPVRRPPPPKPTRKAATRERSELADAVLDKPPQRARRGWGLARIAPRRKAEPPTPDIGPPPPRELQASGERPEGRQSLGADPELTRIPEEELLARLGGPSPRLEDAASTRLGTSSPRQESAAPTRADEPSPSSEVIASTRNDGLNHTLEDAAPTLMGNPRRPRPWDAEPEIFRVPKGKLLTRLGEEVPPWSRRKLRPNADMTVRDILSCPPRWAPNRILAYLETTRPPVRVGPMHAHLQRLRKLIDFIVPANWSNLSAYRQRALLTLWSHWLQLAARLNDLGALPRMRGWEGREFAADRFDALFLAIVGGKVRPGKGEQWDKWKLRFKVGEMTPPELPDEEFARPTPVKEPPDSACPPPRHTFGLKERGREPEPEESVKEKGPVTHYTPPTLYADSPVEKHVEYDQAYARAMKMRGEALAAMREKRAREALKAVSVAVAFMGTVEAHPTEFQLQLIFTHLMDHISFKEIAQYLSEEEQGPMHDVAARLQKVLQPWVSGPAMIEGPDETRSAVMQWDSDHHLPARGQGRRMYAQRKQLLLTVGDMVMSRIEGGGEPETYRRWLEAAEVMLPEWHYIVARYEGLYREASGSQPLRAPTLKEGHALHLLARYAIGRFPRSGMRLPPGAEGTLADPLYCLRLLLGADGTHYFARQKEKIHSVRSKEVDERIVSVAIRWARAAAQRSVLSPVLALLRLLTLPRESDPHLPAGHGSGPPRIPLRLAIYLAGSASAPEDIAVVLPLLERVEVSHDAQLAQAVDTAGWRMMEEQSVGQLAVERSGPHAVLVRSLMLARKADGMDLAEVAAEERDFEERMRRMLQSWGLPVMGKRGETHGLLLQARTQAPPLEAEAEKVERKETRTKERKAAKKPQWQKKRT